MKTKQKLSLLITSSFLIFIHSLAFSAQVDTIFVASQKMNITLPAIVVIPGAYSNTQLKFPVVYLLHGYGGNYLNWMNKADLERLSDRYGFIIVCPDGSKNSWYLDSPIEKNSQYETFVAKELMAWIDDHYPTIAGKQGRAITGLSMGGHGSLYLAFRHLENYIAAGSMSGGVDLTYSTKRWEISKKLGEYEKFPERWLQNSVVNMVDQIKNKNLAILVDCGVDDFFIDINRNLHEKLLQKKIPHDYCERPGRHTWDYWVRVLDYHLLFFNEAFSARNARN